MDHVDLCALKMNEFVPCRYHVGLLASKLFSLIEYCVFYCTTFSVVRIYIYKNCIVYIYVYGSSSCNFVSGF